MCYRNTFIMVSEDSTAVSGVVPVPRHGKPTIASIEYELITSDPYSYTQEDVQFKTYVIKNQIDSGDMEGLWDEFFAKPKACFRASPLVKSYGWGIHYDEQGKIALYDVSSEAYRQFVQSEGIALLKGMRSKRK